MKIKHYFIVTATLVYVMALLLPVGVSAQSPDAADRNYEASVKQGKKTYVGIDGKTRTITKQDVQNVANREAYKKRSFKHIGPGSMSPPIVQEPTVSQKAQAKKKLQEERKQYKKKVLENIKKEQNRINKSRKEAKKEIPSLQKQISKINSEINNEKDKAVRYATAYLDVQEYNRASTELEKQIAILQKDSSASNKLTAEVGIDVPGRYITRQEAVMILGAKKDRVDKKRDKSISRLVKLDNDTANKVYREQMGNNKTLVSNKVTTLREKRAKTEEKIEKLKVASRPLSKEQRKLLSDSVKKEIPKPSSAAENGSGDHAGTGRSSVGSSKAPKGKVNPASFKNTGNYSRSEGDIAIVTYLDIPDNSERSNQRIGNVKVKLDKISGEENCDNRPKTGDLTASTNSKKYIQRKGDKDKLFVHGTLNFKGCSVGKYKVTFIGRDGYELRNGEDKSQTISVEKDKTTEVTFTLVKK